MTGPVDRRRAVQMIASFGALLATSGLAGAAACPVWLAAESDVEGLRELGREYVAGRPADPEVDRIWTLLSADRPAAATITDLGQRMRADYEAGRLVRLTGWYVSITEARIFAAISTRC